MGTKIAVDLGGTNLRVGRVEDGSVAAIKSVACPSGTDGNAVIESMKDLIDDLITPSVEAIGIGVPSIVDTECGIVYDVVNIPSWKEVHLKEILENAFHVRVNVDNDANCFTLGEKYFGDGKAFNNIVGITLGTGVGAGVIIDNKLYHGVNSCAGEIGSLPYLQSDYEHYCSSRFFVDAGGDSKEYFDNAENGEQKALDTWRRFGLHLGKLIQAIMLTYDPEAVIIGGGVSNAHKYFETSMRKSIADGFPYQRVAEKVVVNFSKLAHSNLLGASKL